jgi:uncharacterized protein
MKKIEIRVGERSLKAHIHETPTALKVYNILPFQTKVDTWGDEIYFSIPVEDELDDTAKDLVELGDSGYWPSGNAFCIFYGKTPISQKNEIRPASAVSIIGKVIGDPTIFKGVKDGEKIQLTESDE